MQTAKLESPAATVTVVADEPPMEAECMAAPQAATADPGQCIAETEAVPTPQSADPSKDVPTMNQLESQLSFQAPKPNDEPFKSVQEKQKIQSKAKPAKKSTSFNTSKKQSDIRVNYSH